MVEQLSSRCDLFSLKFPFFFKHTLIICSRHIDELLIYTSSFSSPIISASAFDKHNYDQQLFLDRIASVLTFQRKSSRPEIYESRIYSQNGILNALVESVTYLS